MLPGTSQLLHPTEPVARNGLSLAHNGYHLSVASISGSTVPTCYFANPPARFLARSAVSSPAFTGLPRSRQLLRLQPVAIPRAGSLDCFRCLHSPSGTLTSLGIEAFNSFRRLAARLPNPPDFLSLPASGSITSLGCGSTFLARYVLGVGNLAVRAAISSLAPPVADSPGLRLASLPPVYLWPIFQLALGSVSSGCLRSTFLARPGVWVLQLRSTR